MEAPPVIRDAKAIRRSNRRLLLLLLVVGAIALSILHILVDRTREFWAQAEAGHPIVRAIEDYYKQTGVYPTSLVDLAPKYLPAVPDMPDESRHKFIGWDYRIVTNGMVVSYRLRYSMGRGGIEYKPPNWIGNNEGRERIILRNQ